MRKQPQHVHLFACLTACIVIIVAAGPTLYPATGQSGSRDLTLTKADGTTLRIPTTGPLANATAQEVARAIAEFDRRPAQKPRGVPPEVAEAIRRLALESRNEAVAQLDTTYRVAQTTSGALDNGLLSAARQSAQVVKQIMSTPSPASLQVRTEVDASSANAVIHYCLRGEYRRNTCTWQSYTFGAIMRIGLYMFRVQSEAGQASDEQVLVLNQPTKVTLRPMR